MTQRLNATDWEEIVLNRHMDNRLSAIERIQTGYLDPLVRPLLNETMPGWKVLETGSGWGTLSATLSHQQRQVILMDWSAAVVENGLQLLQESGVNGLGVCADLFSPLPFSTKSVDCVWSSGVLEHFRHHEQVQILKESARVARRKVISLVPNALSLPYRLGKWHMESRGSWEFGYEHPEYSQRSLFEEAGMKNIRETTANAERSGWFLNDLPAGKRLQSIWHRICQLSPEWIDNTARQGYMLVTIGDVN